MHNSDPPSGSILNRYPSVPIDTDADDTSHFKSFEHAMEHPGARSVVALSDKVAHHKFTWWPTEPSDQDCRNVKNDNIVNLYVLFRYTDTILSSFAIDTVIRARVHLNFRGVNFDSKRALQQYSIADHSHQPELKLHNISSQNSDDEEYDMVVEPVPKIANACQ